MFSLSFPNKPKELRKEKVKCYKPLGKLFYQNKQITMDVQFDEMYAHQAMATEVNTSPQCY